MYVCFWCYHLLMRKCLFVLVTYLFIIKTIFWSVFMICPFLELYIWIDFAICYLDIYLANYANNIFVFVVNLKKWLISCLVIYIPATSPAWIMYNYPNCPYVFILSRPTEVVLSSFHCIVWQFEHAYWIRGISLKTWFRLRLSANATRKHRCYHQWAPWELL